MQQAAVFVDAGYFLAQGSVALTGSKQPRSSIFLNVDNGLDSLKRLAFDCAPLARLLRVYWYDGIVAGRLTAQQEQLALSSDCKLRLGLVNSAGEQKGVDSLIVTDMIELARNKAISDAILVSGDEDLRIGVQIAQSHGVKVHLLGIKPARGNQSLELMREADTHREWDEEALTRLMSVDTTNVPVARVDQPTDVHALDGEAMDQSNLAQFSAAVSEALGALTELQLGEVLAAFVANPAAVPSNIDRTMLPRAGQRIGRHLDNQEKRELRSICLNELTRRTNSKP